MVRKSAFAFVTFVSIVFGLCVPLTPAGAVIDAATLVSSPSPGPTADSLSSVSCLNASFCIAVGTTDEGVGNSPLVLKWDGESWTRVTSPNLGPDDNYLRSVSCVSEFLCNAVGNSESESVNYAFVLSLTGPESGPTTSTTSAASDSFTPVFTG
jgi:hypothetical protein